MDTSQMQQRLEQQPHGNTFARLLGEAPMPLKFEVRPQNQKIFDVYVKSFDGWVLVGSVVLDRELTILISIKPEKFDLVRIQRTQVLHWNELGQRWITKAADASTHFQAWLQGIQAEFDRERAKQQELARALNVAFNK